jgi:hypothetical protein
MSNSDDAYDPSVSVRRSCVLAAARPKAHAIPNFVGEENYSGRFTAEPRQVRARVPAASNTHRISSPPVGVKRTVK